MPLDQETDIDALARRISQDKEDKEMSFLDHLEELRWHLIRVVVAIFVFALAAFIYHDFLFDTIIFGPKRTDFWTYRALCQLGQLVYNDDSLCITGFSFRITNITMSGQFTSHMFISLMTGLILAFPYALFELWRFIRPALKEKERKSSAGIVFWGSLLFIAGVLFGYYFLSPISINFMGGYSVSGEVENYINLDSYISFVTALTFGSGLMFQLPLLVYFLAKLGILTAAWMKQYRRYAFMVILVVAAIVTPPDVASQILMTIPIYGLYEVGILIARNVEKSNAKSEKQ
jgi:sec-independent protein translocase protein TatC